MVTNCREASAHNSFKQEATLKEEKAPEIRHMKRFLQKNTSQQEQKSILSSLKEEIALKMCHD